MNAEGEISYINNNDFPQDDGDFVKVEFLLVARGEEGVGLPRAGADLEQRAPLHVVPQPKQNAHNKPDAIKYPCFHCGPQR